MNDDLEQLLASRRPAPLPPGLSARLAASRPSRAPHWLYAAVPLAAAAVLTILLLPSHRIAPRPAAATALATADFHVFVPVAQESTLVNVEKLAVIEPEPAHPMQVVKATWIDHITYRGDDGHSTLRREEPRAEVMLVALDTF